MTIPNYLAIPMSPREARVICDLDRTWEILKRQEVEGQISLAMSPRAISMSSVKAIEEVRRRVRILVSRAEPRTDDMRAMIEDISAVEAPPKVRINAAIEKLTSQVIGERFRLATERVRVLP